ncbi:hypothetical protein [Ralstonia phage vB_RsoP_BMB50]|uniref:Uncharacterized protein n=1 Tax=Ralstonia phage vB_RsoP_BMB50 TaxID=2834269 RepID=A0A8E5KHJ6_9CAUD|nr:hypothetical protein [Ralstonia phage vB_RsoP_BMB50]
MSDNLRAFLRAWLDWAEAGAPDSDRHTERNPNRFDAQCGLCSNTFNFEELAMDVHPNDTGELEEELGDLFESQGRSTGYPFGHAAYDHDAYNGTHHRNTYRLQWVRTQLEA